MNLIIFGATGSVGKQLVIQALSLDYHVTAFIRGGKGPLKDFDHEHLRFLKGDVLDPEQVHEAVKGHDAVFCVIGDGKKGNVRAAGTRNIVHAMESHGMKLLICQSTLGAGESRKNLNFFWKYIMFGWLLKEAYKDHLLQEEYVMNSNLDWTLVRPGALTDGPVTGSFKHGFPASDRSVTLKISKADTAFFLLQQLETDEYIRKIPALSY